MADGRKQLTGAASLPAKLGGLILQGQRTCGLIRNKLMHRQVEYKYANT